MNHALIKAKMDKFFQEVDPNYLVKRLEEMGYAFKTETVVHYSGVSPVQVHSVHYGPKTKSKRHWYQRKEPVTKKVTSESPGSFFCLALHHERVSSDVCSFLIC